MKFNLDNGKDAERMATFIASLQYAGTKFSVSRDEHNDGTFSKYATISFET